MWFVFRLSAALCGFLIRSASRYTSLRLRGYRPLEAREMPLYLAKSTSKNGNISSSRLATKLETRCVFKLTSEGRVDRFFKAIGLSYEYQSGDKRFDREVYVACDRPAFGEELATDGRARHHILELFDKGALYIRGDGRHLWAKFDGGGAMNPSVEKEFVGLAKQFSDIDKNSKRFFEDPFVFRALLAEATIWAVVGYAIAGFADWRTSENVHHLDWYPVWTLGLAVGFVGASLALAFIVFFMKGSSRGHRIIVEGALALGLCLPISGIHFVSDVNSEFDDQPSVVEHRKISDVHRQEHRGRKGRKYYTYHLYFYPDQNADGPYDIPPHLKVNLAVWRDAAEGKTARIEIGPGWLGFPWYRAITIQ